MQAKQTKNAAMKEKIEEDKSIGNKFTDIDIGSVANISVPVRSPAPVPEPISVHPPVPIPAPVPELPSDAKDSKDNSSNENHKIVVNVQNNPSTGCVLDPPSQPLYSSLNPELGNEASDYTDFLDYEEASDE